MSELKQRLQDDMKAAMRAKDKARLTTVRLVLAAVKQVEIDGQSTLDDDKVTVILNKLVKQRKDAITQYQNAERPELAEKEQAELAIIQEYLPAMLSESEVDQTIERVIAATGATEPKDMGKVMGPLKAELGSRADFSKVSQKVKARLSA
ncbi:GatB/YqeY domain-containing protein [Piscirickettsia litoralis]|uniref:Glutamyl-tRNA amidotransferase n=1 Tax=Piscirickettsia litoralis TaxID=1891921 RepID=A0ABX3A4B1_9GAMM|nr:GatB/YqeY domain-containing protein [Piscirickettsia litoralis]ODN43706.1 glutamyl-tRNA amidotransferase [Piscirickettsia litoralis]